jgi:putative endonuclease
VSAAPHLALGRAAEAAAARHLERCGYRILTANFRAKGGELDLVAMEGTALAIIEVRSRIVRAARALLATHPPLAKLPARFDVVEVTGPVEALRCALIRGAFSV